MKKLILYSLTVFILFSSCKKGNNNSPVIDTTVEVRILNATAWTFFDCTADPTGVLSATGGSNAHNYGQVDVNAHSPYHSFPLAYRYSWINLTMNNKTYRIQPFDYVGETPLTTGKYTYKLTYNSTSDLLSLQLIKE